MAKKPATATAEAPASLLQVIAETEARVAESRRGRKMAMEFDRNIFDRILEDLANGRSLTNICKDDHTPSYSTFTTWITKDPDLFEEYLRARQMQADYLAEEQLDIADQEENVAKARNMIETRRWYAARLNPKYRDRGVEINNTTINNAADVKIDLSYMSEEARAELKATLLEQMQQEDPALLEGIFYEVENE